MAFSLANLPSSPGVYCWSAGRFCGGGKGVVTGADGVMGCGRVVGRKGVLSH
jgi:hypothetical protein